MLEDLIGSLFYVKYGGATWMKRLAVYTEKE